MAANGAAKDFGAAEFVSSVQLSNTVINYKSTVFDDRYYNFRRKNQKTLKSGCINEYWICLDCEKQILGNFKLQFCKITVCNGRIITDPDTNHHENCRGRTFAMVEATKLDREARNKCRMGQNPLNSYGEMLSKARSQDENMPEQDKVQVHLPKFERVEKGYRRWTNRASKVVEMPKRIRSSDGKVQTTKDDIYAGREKWLLTCSPDHSVLAIASDQDIKVMHESTNLIINGFYKIMIHGFIQYYTIYAWGRFEKEAIPVCHVVVRSNMVQPYVYLFEKIREKLFELHGGIGSLKYVTADFDKAAHLALKQVFPELIVKGCNFNFGHMINAKLLSLGLHGIWEDDGKLGDWIGLFKALAFLPPIAIPVAFEIIRRQMPILISENTARALHDFLEYFINFWLSSAFPVNVWNHWDSEGPITTNFTDEYRDRMNLIDVHTTYLTLNTFFELLQPLHNRDQLRIQNLRDGRCQPRPLEIEKIELDRRMLEAKLYFYRKTYSHWHDWRTVQLNPVLRHDLERELYFFLLHMRHFVGEKIRAIVNTQ